MPRTNVGRVRIGVLSRHPASDGTDRPEIDRTATPVIAIDPPVQRGAAALSGESTAAVRARVGADG
jgi:hypothetical protein